MRALDLGGGTGANVRYLSSRLPTPQFWTIVDNDAALLERAPVHATRRHADLNAAVADEELFAGSSIVTASALLDLVSERWLAKLIERCRAAGAGVLFALNYDGRIVCSPEEREDDDIRRLVNQHQKQDKGFGPALGPTAASAAADLFRSESYEVGTASSDWVLNQASAADQLQEQLIDGWAHAESAMMPDGTMVEEWRRRRRAHVAAGRSALMVGHQDLAAFPVRRFA